MDVLMFLHDKRGEFLEYGRIVVAAWAGSMNLSRDHAARSTCPKEQHEVTLSK
jgi:hypothetical protein